MSLDFGKPTGLLFLIKFNRPCKFTTETIGSMEGRHYMEGMGLKWTTVVVIHLLGPLSMFGTMGGTC